MKKMHPYEAIYLASPKAPPFSTVFSAGTAVGPICSCFPQTPVTYHFLLPDSDQKCQCSFPDILGFLPHLNLHPCHSLAM